MSGRTTSTFIFIALVFGNCCPAATFVVSNTQDSGPGSFRQAILDSSDSPGLDTVQFAIPGTGPFRISLSSTMPALGEPVEILGNSQPGFTGTPLVEIYGGAAGSANGLDLLGGGNTIRSIGIVGFSKFGISIQGAGENILIGNFIGCTGQGRTSLGNGMGGVFVGESPLNIIGGTNLWDRNVISGNGGHGIEIRGESSFFNSVVGNFIGTDSTGTNALRNATNGIHIVNAQANRIGGSSPAERNVISGNKGNGIVLVGPSASNNEIFGNYIGLDYLGRYSISNWFEGIALAGGTQNYIGSAIPGSGNVVSGNGNFGVSVSPVAVSNFIYGNFLGTDASGSYAVGNRRGGAVLYDSSFNRIGGTNQSERNVISGNKEDGVVFLGSGSRSNVVQGNYIGLNAAGDAAISNLWSGVRNEKGVYNVIGGTNAQARNVISGNADHGIIIADGPFAFATIQGNFIGTDRMGTRIIGNGLQGVRLGAGGNQVGGSVAGAGNVISGNEAGIYALSSTNNVMQGNLIGVDVFGTNNLGNLLSGVILERSSSNLVGGNTDLARNIISGNTNHGVRIYGVQSVFNRVVGNFIGTDITGSKGIKNLLGGIYFYNSGTNTVGGSSPGEGNLISGNGQSGISVGDPGANGNVIIGNSIGIRYKSIVRMANSVYGIEFVNTASNNKVGGTNPGEANTIQYGASGAGIAIGDTTQRNAIRANSIFSSNGGVAIDITKDKVTTNDVNDVDTGGNLRQNYPVLMGANGRYVTTVTGFLNSTPGKTFALDFFASTLSNAPAGQAEFYLGSRSLFVNASSTGQFVFSFTNNSSVPIYISATATDPDGNSSEVSFAVAASTEDLDNDGLPDDFERGFGLNPFGHSANEDADGDGLSNLVEYLLGTIPNSAASRVGLAGLSKEGRQITLSVDTVPGRNYRVEYADNLSGPWSQGPRIVATSSHSTVTTTIPNNSARRFYRLYQE